MLVWDTKTDEVTSLSSEVMVGQGGVRKEGGGNGGQAEAEGVWVVELQEGLPSQLEGEEDAG